jgi:hypothetical protein
MAEARKAANVLDAAVSSLCAVSYALGAISSALFKHEPAAARHIVDAVNALERAGASLQAALKVIKK